MKFLHFFLFLTVIFALLDSDPLTWMNPDPVRIQIPNTAGSYLGLLFMHFRPRRVVLLLPSFKCFVLFAGWYRWCRGRSAERRLYSYWLWGELPGGQTGLQPGLRHGLAHQGSTAPRSPSSSQPGQKFYVLVAYILHLTDSCPFS
jgi:hypothetical protein